MSLTDRRRKTLQRGGTFGRYLPSGHLAYVNRGTLFAVPFDLIRTLLEHEEPEVQQFGAKLLESSGALATLPVESWLKLLQTKNDEALQRICDAFSKHVSGERLNLAQDNTATIMNRAQHKARPVHEINL